MAKVNTLKMIGLVVLLAIALALPTVLPKVGDTQSGHAQDHRKEIYQAAMV